MDEMTISEALGCLYKTLGEISDKHFVQKVELSQYEQNLLNDLHTLVVHSQYQERIRQHFGV